jgi:segregation and condensation protein B
MDDLKKKIEAILFSLGKFVSTEEIANLCKEDESKVKDALLELTTDYEDKNTSLIVISDNNLWKLTTREEYSHLVRKIVSETELTKSQLETLAVIAFKYPIKQSDLIRIRTNKAYDHLMELEKAGFITRQRYGRSRLIKLTDKFFEYFDLPREKLKERFLGFDQLAHKIEVKENEKDRLKEEQKREAEQDKIEAEKEQELMDGKLDLDDDSNESGNNEEIKEKVGDINSKEEGTKTDSENNEPQEITNADQDASNDAPNPDTKDSELDSDNKLDSEENIENTDQSPNEDTKTQVP